MQLSHINPPFPSMRVGIDETALLCSLKESVLQRCICFGELIALASQFTHGVFSCDDNVAVVYILLINLLPK
ncbi:hypothetical protein EMCRGX_G021844 [Ephydatia muelleri]